MSETSHGHLVSGHLIISVDTMAPTATQHFGSQQICFKKTTKSVFKLGSTSFEFKFEGVSPVYEEKHLKVYSESEEVAAEN